MEKEATVIVHGTMLQNLRAVLAVRREADEVLKRINHIHQKLHTIKNAEKLLKVSERAYTKLGHLYGEAKKYAEREESLLVGYLQAMEQNYQIQTFPPAPIKPEEVDVGPPKKKKPRIKQEGSFSDLSSSKGSRGPLLVDGAGTGIPGPSTPVASPPLAASGSTLADTMLHPGQQIAAKVSSGSETKKKEVQWILARVIRYIPEKDKYEIEDEDEAEDQTKKRHVLMPKYIMPLASDDCFPELPKDSDVLAVYPETTTFYPAKIVGKLKKNAAKAWEYTVQFSEDGEQKWKVPFLMVIPRHGGINWRLSPQYFHASSSLPPTN